MFMTFAMWKILLFMFLLQIRFTPIHSMRDASLILDNYQFPTNLKVTLAELIKQRFRPAVFNEPLYDQQQVYHHEKLQDQKRAFSILARMKPFSDFGKQRTSVRQMLKSPAILPPVSNMDIVSAETRAMFRPIGQPLRWG